MLQLSHIPPAQWRRYAKRHQLGSEIPSPRLRLLEIDPHHGLPLEAWAQKLRRAAVDEYAQRKPADLPTAALPGTDAKVAVMEARVAAGRSPFRPGDKDLREFQGGTADDRRAYLPHKMDNGNNTVSVTSATHTYTGVAPCASIANCR